MAKSSHCIPIDEEYAEILKLPTTICIKDGNNFCEKFLARKEKEHEQAVFQMKNDLKKINEEIAELIWLESTTLKTFLMTEKKDIEEWTDNNIRTYLNKLVEVKSDIFKSAKSKVEAYEKNCLGMIDNYYEKLKNLEVRRCDSLKTVLKNHFIKLQNVKFKLPNELLEFFEAEILRLNQVSLSNYQHYVDLHAELKIQVEEHVQQILKDIKKTEDQYNTAINTQKVTELVNLKFYTCDVVEIFDGEKKFRMVEKVTTMSEGFYDGLQTTPAEDLNNWYKEIRDTLDTLDLNAKKLVELYKSAIFNIFNRFFDELQKITIFAMNEEHIRRTLSEPSHDKESTANYLKNIIEEVTRQNKCEIEDLQNLWNSMIAYMQANIKSTYDFLDSSTHLWEAHFARINTVQCLVLKDLKNVIDKNNMAAKNFEKKINKALDLLRQASTKTKLDEYWKQTNKLLDSVANLFSKQCEDEIKIIKKYQKLMDQEIDVLLAEIQKFLSENSNKECQSEKNCLKTETPSVTKLNENLVPHHMKRCKYQVDAVDNWVLGLWEALRIYSVTCRNELTEETNQWVMNQVCKLKKRAEVRLVAHKPRYMRIKQTVYDVRLKELEDHGKIMATVEKVIGEYMASSRASITYYKHNQMAELENYKKNLDEIERKAKSAKRSLQILSYLERTNTLGIETKEHLENDFQQIYNEVTDNLGKGKQSIADVTTAIKLFADGGTFSHEEVKNFVAKLNKSNKTLPKKFSKIFNELAAVKRDIFHLFQVEQSKIVTRLEKSKKEFEHNESAILKMRKLRNDLLRKVHAVKYKLMRIESAVEYYIIMSKIDVWKSKNFELMKVALTDCLEKITDVTGYLIWSENGLLNDETSNYFWELNRMIQSTLEDIDSTAKVFYGEHGDIVNEGKVQPSYELFMEEIWKNFICYKKQVKINSLEFAQELIDYVLKFLKINDEIYENLVEKYPEALEEKIEDIDEWYDKLSRESSLIETKRKLLEEDEEESSSVVSSRSTKEVVNPDVEDLVQNNTSRENLIHFLINSLYNHLKDKLDLMESLVPEEGLDVKDKKTTA